jgi:hypothetical protein
MGKVLIPTMFGIGGTGGGKNRRSPAATGVGYLFGLNSGLLRKSSPVLGSSEICIISYRRSRSSSRLRCQSLRLNVSAPAVSAASRLAACALRFFQRGSFVVRIWCCVTAPNKSRGVAPRVPSPNSWKSAGSLRRRLVSITAGKGRGSRGGGRHNMNRSMPGGVEGRKGNAVAGPSAALPAANFSEPAPRYIPQ